MSIARETVMNHILAQCPPPSDRSDRVGRQINVDTCMRPLAHSLGYDGCPACLGDRLRVAGDLDSGPCPTCDGTGVVRLEDLP